MPNVMPNVMPNADSIRDAIREAVAEAKAETPGFQEFVPAIERWRSAPAPEPAGDGDGDGGDPSPEELARIHDDPRLRDTYRRLTRRFSEKSQRIDRQRQEGEMAVGAVEAIRANPRDAVRALAAARGYEVREQPTMEDRVREHLVGRVGQEAADILAPVLVSTITEVASEIARPVLGPIHRDYQERQRAAQRTRLLGEITTFAESVVSDGGEWNEEVEKEMASLVDRISPGPRTTVPQFLQALHSAVTATRRKRGKPAPAPKHRAINSKMDPKDAARLAVEQAEAEVGARRRR